MLLQMQRMRLNGSDRAFKSLRWLTFFMQMSISLIADMQILSIFAEKMLGC